MAELEVAPLIYRVEEDLHASILRTLKAQGIPVPEKGGSSSTSLGTGLDEDALREFLDILGSHDAACDVYLPLPDDRLHSPLRVGGLTVGSTAMLVAALEEIRDDLDIDDYGEEGENEEGDDDGLEGKLRGLWRLFAQGAEVARQKHLPLHVHS